jgi:site-specific DNA recombinase
MVHDILVEHGDISASGLQIQVSEFDIPIPRDGGIQDLLAEAERADRRFDFVICESIDRIARRTYIATDIENRLERAGIRLLAADEPFTLAQEGAGRKAKVATQLLTRRVKQGISEFYVVEMLEKSWDGIAVHTEEGFNIGKPCYGFQAKHVPHPVPAKRAKGQKKTFLEPNPAEAPVVKRIFTWRLEERLGYQPIADRLNLDLTTNPPPTPNTPSRKVGLWTYSNVRDILTNPKYTGHMVWNRRARKSAGNKRNHVSEWVWSPQPVHEVLVDLDTFIQVQQVSGHRFGSRTAAGANTKHPQTKRSYLFRTYLFCALCGRRMGGKTRKRVYYACAPRKAYLPAGHPAAGGVFVREDHLLDKVNAFLSDHVFGAYRRQLLDANIRHLDAAAAREREQQVAGLRRAITDIDVKIKRTIHNFELVDDPDEDFVRDINERRAELRTQRDRLATQLAEVEQRILAAPNPDLLDALPVMKIEVEQLPADLARALFEALRLEIRYDRDTHTATCRITLTGSTINAASRTAHDAAVISLDDARQCREQRKHDETAEQEVPPTDDESVPILVVPPGRLAQDAHGLRIRPARSSGWAGQASGGGEAAGH